MNRPTKGAAPATEGAASATQGAALAAQGVAPATEGAKERKGTAKSDMGNIQNPDRVIVIGAGAAGMMASCAAASQGASVLLLEKNEKTGKKIYITGKGRCNFTNLCETEDFFENVPRNASFLYSSVYGFDPHAVRDWFEEHGVRTKEERGNRAFPLSDHASDITRCLEKEMRRLGVEVRLNTEVSELLFCPEDKDNQEEAGSKSAETTSNKNETGSKSTDITRQKEKTGSKSVEITRRVCGVRLSDGTKVFARSVIVATGGLSYPSTGSTGDGYRFARSAGHSVSRLSPSLVPFNVKEEDITRMQGLSLKNVTLTVSAGKKKLFRDMGEMMFTHFGVTGPLVLSASALVQDKIAKGELQAQIDLKPALSEEKLDARILREFEDNRNRSFHNAVKGMYPSKMIPVIIQRTGIDPDTPVHDVTTAMRRELIRNTKQFTFTITSLRGWNEAIITRGGVSVKEIDPGSMESKLAKGLFFAGEVLDTDAFTGGFNLQIAWSTGYAAGQSCMDL